MNINHALAAIAAQIQSSTGINVQVARPAEAITALVIWPWKVSDSPFSINSLPPRQNPTGVHAHRPVVVEVSFLMLASPDGSIDRADELLQAHRALLDNPEISSGDGSCRVVVKQLSVTDLAEVFTAAQLRLSLCTNYSLQITL